jgi:TP901 family phage tail tape measure protein
MLNNMGLGFLFTAKDLASGTMGKIKSGLLEVEGAASPAGKAVGEAFKRFGTGLAVMGMGLAGMAVLAPALEEASKFSKAIALVATETDEATFAQSKMREVAEGLAVTYGKAPVEQAQALYKAVALGANTAAKSQDFLNGVNLLAVAGNADLETSANALGGALNAYGEKFDKATAYSDTLFTGMRLGNTTVQDLASSVGRVTASAHNLGVSFDEIVGATAVMTNQGVKADEAVSGLKEALANVVHPSADAAKEAARLGIKFTQTELRAKGLQGFLDEITHSSRFTANSMSKLFTSVEGSNAIMQVTTGSMGQFNDVMTEMGKKSGATKRGFDIMTETLDFQEQRFMATGKVAVGMIGSALEPLAKATIKVANAILEAFTKTPKPVVAFFTKLALGAATFLTVIGAAMSLHAAFALLSAGMSAVGITFGGLLLAMAGPIAAVGLLMLAFEGLRQSYELNIGGFRDFVDKAFHDVKLAFEGLGQVFSQGGFSGDVMQEMDKAENGGIKQFVINVYAWGKRLEKFWDGLSTGFSDGLDIVDDAVQGFWHSLNMLRSQFAALTSGPESPEAATNVFNDFGDSGETVGQSLAKVFGFVAQVMTVVVDVISGVIAGYEKMGDGSVSLGDTLGVLVIDIRGALVELGILSDTTKGASSGWVAFGQIIGGNARMIVRLIQPIVWLVEKLGAAMHALHGGGIAEIQERLEHGRGSGMGISGVMERLQDADGKGVRTGTNRGIIQRMNGAGTFNGKDEDDVGDAFRKQKTFMGFSDEDMGDVSRGKGGDTMFNTMPAAAAASGHTAPADTSVMAAHLEAIAKSVSQPSSFRATVVLDGSVIGTAVAKSNRNEGTRGFAPAPVET